jgi:ADP-L-glycero-D-manno-heptose 6-epimerase
LPDSWSLPTTFRPRSLEGVVSTLFDRYALPKSINKSYLSLKHYRLFGPGERTDEGVYGLIKTCYHQICSTGAVCLPAALQPGTPEGDRTHDFCYVLDAARVAALLGQSPQAAGVYELGSGSSCTAAALAETVFAVLGLPPAISWDPSLPFTPPSAEPEAANLQRVREAGFPANAQELADGVGHYIHTYLQSGLTIGEDLESPEPAPAPAVEIKTPILLPRKKVRVAS